MANRAGPKDWLSAERVSDDGHVAYRLNVNVVSGGGGGGAVTIANGADIAEGSTTDAAYADATGAAAGSQISLEKALFVAMKATGANAQNVQGAQARGSTVSVNPVLAGGRGNNGLPSAVTANQLIDNWLGVNGQTIIGSGSQTGTPTTSATATNLIGDASGNGRPIAVTSYVSDGGSTLNPIRGDTNGLNIQLAMTGSRWQFAGATGGITDTTPVALAAAAGAGVRNYVAAIQYANTSAVGSEIVVLDGATVIWRGFAQVTTGTENAITFPIPLKGTANTAMNVAMITTGTATRVSAQGFTGV